MKKIYCLFLFSILSLTLLFYSCSSEKDSMIPTATTYNSLKLHALHSLSQNIEIFGSGDVNFTSIRGVNVSIDRSSLTLNGNPVASPIDINFVEIFAGDNMVVTGKHTMGQMPDGNRSLLLSGGEFYINATKNGQQLELNGTITVLIPATLTGEDVGNPDMTLWDLAVNDSVWVPNEFINPTGANGVVAGPGQKGLRPGPDDGERR